MLSRLIKLYISTLLYLCDCIGATLMKILKKPFSGTCVVLYYHGVPTEEREAFRRQMAYLVRRTVPISIGHDGKLDNNHHYSAITFDDGFANIFENALPILKQWNIPAAIFIPTAYIGRFPGWIWDHSESARSYQLADRDLIVKLANEITIGSHTVSHPDLTKIPVENVDFELKESKTYLEKLTGKNIDFLSFPHGRYNQSVIELGNKAGYSRLFSIEPDYCVGHLNRKIIGRVTVSPSDWAIEFHLKMIGGYRWMKHASKIKHTLFK